MSQSGILCDITTALSDIEKLTGDTGGAITPDAAHNINIIGATSTAYDNEGILVAGTLGTNTLAVTLTNRAQGSVNTTGAVTGDAITFACGTTPGTYKVEAFVCGFEATTPAGCGYTLNTAVRTTGAAATLCGTTDRVNNEEAALILCNADVVVNANTFIVRVLGVAGLTIHWNAIVNIVFIS